MKGQWLPLASFWAVLALLFGCAPAAVPTAASKAAAVPQAETPAAKAAASPAAPTGTPKPAADQPRSGGVLKAAAYMDEATFDLHVSGRNLVVEHAGLSYSGLLQCDPTDGTRIITDLAESYQTSADGKKVTFLLKKNVRCHDGKPFTAEDVRFNFDRWIKPPEGVVITRKEIVANVDRVETPDAATVDIYLKSPSPSAIPLFAMAAASMLPPQFLKDNKTMGYTILGTGPYKLKRYTRGVSVEHVKNEDYFITGRPYLDGVSQYMIPDNSARLAALRTGQIRMTFLSQANMTPSQAELLKTQMSDKLGIARILALGDMFVLMNQTRPPFNDLRVRQAVDMALDRKKAIDVVEGRAKISALLPPGSWSLSEEELVARPGYRGVSSSDIEKARGLLREAGYPEGFKTSTIATTAYSKQAVFIQDQLKAVGIQVNIDMVDQPTLDRRMIAGEIEMTVYPVTVPIDDPDGFLALAVTGGGRNYVRFSDKQIDDWNLEQSREMDPAKRKDIVLKAQRRLLDLAGLPVLYGQVLDLPYWKCVKGFYPEKQVGLHNNYKKQDIWLDEGCR